MTYRCPFCDFDRSHPPVDDPDWSAVQSVKEIAVHIVLAHPGEWQELRYFVEGEAVR